MLRTRPRIGFLALLAWMGCAPMVYGQSFTWDGNTAGTGTSWAIAANWFNTTTSTNDVLPTSGSNIEFSNVNVVSLIPSAMTVSSNPTYGLITFDNINNKLPSSLIIYGSGSGGSELTTRTITVNNGITIANSSTTVTFKGAFTNVNTLAISLGGNVNFSASPGGTLNIESVISGAGRISVLGGGTVALTGNNVFTGGVTVTGNSTLVLGHVNGLGVPAITDTALTLDNAYVRTSNTSISLASTRGITITANGATMGAFPGNTLTVNGVIKESGGPSRLTIGNASSSSGQVVLGANSNVSGGFSDGVTVQNGATLNIATSTALGVLPLSYDPDNVLLNNGILRVNSGSLGLVLAAVRGVTITPLGATLFSPTATASLTVSSAIVESGGASRLTITGGGTVTLGGTSNGAGGYTGGVEATGTGTVFSISTSAALGVAPVSIVPNHIMLNSGTTFGYSNTGGTSSANRGWQIGPNTGSGTATISLTRTTPGSTFRIDGVIANQPGGSGGLNLTGTGNILTLTGANTFSGGTQINSGTLLVNSPATPGVSGTGGGNVNVNSGATLGGTGFILPSNPNTVAVAAGGTLAPGSAGAGTLSIFGPTSLASDATLKISISGSPTPSGLPGSSSLGTAPAFSTNTFLNVAGTLTLDPGMKLMIDGTTGTFIPGQSYSFTVAQATTITGITPGYDNRLTFDPAFRSVGFVSNPSDLALFVGDGTLGEANTVYVTLTVTPEPGTLLFFGAVGLAAVRTLRRK